MDPVALFLISTLVILMTAWVLKKRKNTPPGPTGYPIVGYITKLTSKPHKKLQELGEKYGPVFSVKLGSRTVIVLDDFQSSRDAFVQEAFMGRPPENPFNLNKKTLETMAFNGLPWKEQRRFSLQMLRDLGFGRSHLEDMMKEEITELLQQLEMLDKNPSPIRPLVAPSMSNNIACLVFGQRLPFDHPDRKMMDRVLTETSEATGQTAWTLFFPWLATLLDWVGLGSKGKIDAMFREFKVYTEKQISDHEKTLEPGNIRDFIDGYLLEIQKRKEDAFCKDVLQDLIGGFFGAGSETVRLTIEWLMLTMAAHPHVQKKVQDEVDEVVGQSRLPSWNDHSRMAYTQAVICELMRWRTIIPVNPLRYTLWDTELNGYFIPKHSYILANLWSIHHNKKYWGDDADEFRPERFLEENGKEVKKFDNFIPFSIGKRSCPGEKFARTEVFLYFAAIMQKFQVSFADGSTPDFEGELGIGLVPKPQKLRLQKRF